MEINGKKVYCREADARVLTAFIAGEKSDKKVSVRDHVTIRLDSSASYKLWDTELVRRNVDGSVWIYITDNSDMEHVYYGIRGRRRPVAITQTTKNRLDTFLEYYGLNKLEAHSSKKIFGVWHNGVELKNNTWYLIDTENKNLVEIK